ncbi:CMGC/CLK protein kinase [Paracoccidioides brasiliensis Pb18]|uniref:dual-specificity kinase n=1 Tax=Paracoccidioides brasiliensis (strain Pb18) TaxID=502780 RepID=C1GH37_PARBD|nr:CMGC/CLK protein kinase [Paracoccidioides brasiliensis Pb18]EEH50494.1 CMGC/CLK protein kinase [Paracoccidioides brasiliensis Pb18]ODH46549.1 CMGC/CLK protein kinase [Paracoccidioides brasiliensis]
MSTPSTATATHPSRHPHYGYSHHTYQQNTSYPSASAAVAAVATGSSRLANSYGYSATTPATTAAPPLPLPSPSKLNNQHQVTMPSYQQQQHNHQQHHQQPSSPVTLPTSRSRRKKPNWAEFYKNGVPKEIIVIDDDDDSITATNATFNNNNSSNSNNNNNNNHLNSTLHKMPVSHAPASKRRRTGLETAVDMTYHDRPTFSIHPQQYGEESSGTSISTDRTTSLQTTAPTSMGSHGSAPLNNMYYEDSTTIGQKRKRVVTRKSARDEQKRRELEVAGDAYNSYIPPPKPPIKAKDVTVPVIRDYNLPKNQKIDDDDGHYIVTPDTDLTDRYSIVKLLGQGTFGKVVEAYDKHKKTRCAVKIIRSVQKYRDASRIELRVLSTLASNDKTNRNKCIHLRDCFDFRNHICIVTDLLGQSVFDFLKGNGFVPFPSSQIQSFARQLLTSVAFLHDLNLIHTDLKPENILLVNNAYQTFTYNRSIPSSSHTSSRNARQRRVLLNSEIRLIDFGSATFNDEYHSSVVSTRHYRAPEIILNLGWSFPCDIWSIGCILVEFFTGDALFQTHDNLEHLAMMESVCGGKIDAKIVKQVMQCRGGSANQAAKYFNRSKLDYPNTETSKASKKYVRAMKPLHDFIPTTTTFNKQFLDLLRRIFVYDPKARITAKQALKHPWFKESIIDDGTEALRIGQQLREDAAAKAASASAS